MGGQGWRTRRAGALPMLERWRGRPRPRRLAGDVCFRVEFQALGPEFIHVARQPVSPPNVFVMPFTAAAHSVLGGSSFKATFRGAFGGNILYLVEDFLWSGKRAEEGSGPPRRERALQQLPGA